MSDKNDFFSHLEFEDIEIDNRQFQLPVCYYDLIQIGAGFAAKANKLKKLLPSKKLKLITPFPGISMIFFIGYKYKKLSNIEPYNEFGVGVPVSLNIPERKEKIQGIYLLHLPVSTEDSMRGGIELWGYPKWLADISFEENSENISCKVKKDDQLVFELKVEKVAASFQSWSGDSFTILKNKILRTTIPSQGNRGVSSSKGGATINFGVHPIGNEVKKLLLLKKSLGHEYNIDMQLILPRATEQYPM